MKFVLIVFAIFALLSLVLWILGPRYILTKAPEAEYELPADLDAYLKKEESAISGIKKGTQKEIIWASETKTRTAYSVIYLHGFVSSRKELSPVVENVAESLGANLYFARLTGHGCESGQLLADVEKDDWMKDALEALAIGKSIGEKVIVIGTSHGGLLGSWLASLESNDEIAALIAVSPNFGPKDKRTKLLPMPWGKALLPKVFGSQRTMTPQNSGHEYYWNTNYPAHALFPMMAQVNYITPRAPFNIHCPTLFLYSTKDSTVDHTYIEKAFNQIPSQKKKLVIVHKCGDKDNHILGGDILSPGTTVEIQEEMTDFIRSL